MRRPHTLRRLRTSALLLLFCCFFSGCVDRGREYPSRPIILVCPWAAGGGTDRVARQLAVGLEQDLGVPVNVVNAIGASGVTGHTRGALARPDGYTITMMTVELNMLHWRDLTPISTADFSPLALVNRDPAAIFVRRDAPWRTLAELNDHIRQNPRTLRASGTALGGIWHVALAGWLTGFGSAGDAVQWISRECAAPSFQELMAGGVEIVSSSLPEARSLLDAGEIRSLGVMSDERVPEFPGIPTLKEQGVDAVLGTWRGIGLPAETPAAVTAVMAGALERVVNGPDFREFMKKAGFNWAYEGPVEFERTLAGLDARFGELLRSDAFSNLGEGIVGPLVFPSILGGLGLVVLVSLLASGGLKNTAVSDAFSWRGSARVAEILAAILVYVLAAEVLGFIVTAVVLIGSLMLRLGVRWRVTLLVSVFLVVIVYQIFAIFLRVPLPRGVFGW